MVDITSVLIGRIYLLITLTFSVGCLDRTPAPVCPVPIEVSTTDMDTAKFDGVDLLVVIDNSASMEKEQQILSTGFFTLINSLAKPLEDSDWNYPPVKNMRVAIVSSDMGFQYGPKHESVILPSETKICKDIKGDDGQFLNVPAAATTPIISGKIRCDADGKQCPTGYSCKDGACYSESGDDLLVCNFSNQESYTETEQSTTNPDFTEQLACLALQGTDGCGIEQQLEASVRALEREEQKAFLKKSHLLAVLVVSDEEDCSIKDPNLFSTKQWSDEVNTACNLNEDMLFETSRYKEELVAIKDNQKEAVIFAAIVGVPTVDACQGDGAKVAAGGCLNLEAMKLEELKYESKDGSYVHFREACSRYDKDGNELTLARPGRRYVKVAEDFGKNGYIYSICNDDWSPAMQTIAEIIARQIEPTCYPKQLEWDLLPEDEKEKYPDCEGCGWAKCNVVMEQPITEDIEDPSSICPTTLYEGLSASDVKKYKDMVVVKKQEESGNVVGHKVQCPMPKLPTKLDCETAQKQVDALYSDQAGWFYCENAGGLSGNDVCNDGVDNNDNSLIDCEDPTCSTCQSCGGEDATCHEGCRYGVTLNQKAKDLSADWSVTVQCLQRPQMEDPNCREDSPLICNDEIDNDGNGVWDCDNTLTDPNAEEPHLADPNCCPMTVENGKCVPLMPELKAQCSMSPKLSSQGADFWTNPINAQQVGACIAQKEMLECEW